MPFNSSYRKRAALALGRALTRTEHVHHHSETQLVICDRAYHHWLHAEMRRRGMDRRVRPLSYIVRGLETELWRAVRVKAALEGRSIKALIEALLRQWVERPPQLPG